MTSLTACSHCSSYTHVTVLPVHIVGTTTRIISQPYTNVLDLQRTLLRHLPTIRHKVTSYFNKLSYNRARDYFASCLLQLLQFTGKIEESRLCCYLIGGKYSHTIKRRIWLRLRRMTPSDYFIFLQLQHSTINLRLTTINKKSLPVPSPSSLSAVGVGERKHGLGTSAHALSQDTHWLE